MLEKNGQENLIFTEANLLPWKEVNKPKKLVARLKPSIRHIRYLPCR
jgi:hypothetical protein